MLQTFSIIDEFRIPTQNKLNQEASGMSCYACLIWKGCTVDSGEHVRVRIFNLWDLSKLVWIEPSMYKYPSMVWLSPSKTHVQI